MSKRRNRRLLVSQRMDPQTRRQQASGLIRIALRVVLVIVLLVLLRILIFGLRSKNHNSSSPLPSLQTQTRRENNSHNNNSMRSYLSQDCRSASDLTYELRESGRYHGAAFVRYAAMMCARNDDDDRGSSLQSVSVHQWADMLSSSADASTSLTELLRQTPYQAFFFETKGVTSASSRETAFEFVLVDAPALHAFCRGGEADPDAFAEHLECLPKQAAGCVFPNLGGTATLVAPRQQQQQQQPSSTEDHHQAHHYSHLAAFVRHSPPNDQVANYWQLVARTYLDRLNEMDNPHPVWCSTSGTGVAWLHFRLDQRPKYYQYRPFADYESSQAVR